MSGTINEIWPCHEINPTKVYGDNQTYSMGMCTRQASLTCHWIVYKPKQVWHVFRWCSIKIFKLKIWTNLFIHEKRVYDENNDNFLYDILFSKMDEINTPNIL
jgi:hypothetical protein